MEPIEELIKEIDRQTVHVGFSYWVYITHVNSPHSFYVRPKNYNFYLSTVQARGDPIDKSEIKVGTIVVFKSEDKKDYIRGKILSIEGENDITYHLFAIDDGSVELNVPLQKIWKPLHTNLPPLAYQCQLGNCEPLQDTWHEASAVAIREFAKGRVAKITINTIMCDVVIVEVSISCPDDLATLLALSSHSTLTDMDEIDEDQFFMIGNEILQQIYPERELKLKSVLRVRMLSGSFLDKFYVAPVDEYKKYLENREEYTTYAYTQRRMDYYELEVNAPVCIYYSHTDKFERARVREIFPKTDRAKVELVDWCKVLEEPIELLRPIPARFLDTPAMAICCGLHSSQYSMTKPSEISTPGVEFDIKIEEIGEGDLKYLVTVANVKE